MAYTRQLPTLTLLPNSKVLVAGGVDTGGNYRTIAELWDPATGVWTATGQMLFGCADHGAVLLNSGKVLVVAGYGTGGRQNSELYDPYTGALERRRNPEHGGP